MDLKMHVYSVPLRSPFAFPCVPWNFEVGNASDQKLEVGELRSPTSYYTLTTDVEYCRNVSIMIDSSFELIRMKLWKLDTANKSFGQQVILYCTESILK